MQTLGGKSMRKTLVALNIILLAACAPTADSATELPAVAVEAVSVADSDDAADSRDESFERSGDAAARQRRVARIKARIRAIAIANTTRTDNLPEVRAQLLPLVERLSALTPRLTEAEKLSRSVGPWHNLWSNLSYGSFAPDLQRVYQVVTNTGHYWNLSQAPGSFPGIGPVFNALRGAYAPIPTGLAIRFTRDGLVPGTLVGRTGAGLVMLASDIERGATPLAPLPGGGVAPLRITGTLTTAYVDNDLRIIGGDSAPRFDDNGVVQVPGQYDLLFVLERQVGPIP
jgi:hypothetical protein